MAMTQAACPVTIRAMTSAEKISWLCRERGLTQKRVGELAALPENRISKWLDGQGEPTARQALRLARVLSVPLEWLADDAQEVPPPASDGLDDDDRMVLRQWKHYRNRIGLTAEEAIDRLAGSRPIGPTFDDYPMDAQGESDSPAPPRSGRRSG